jgi:hypothetical protein
MLQPDSTLPAVPLRPAPWDLCGTAWIVVLKLPAGAPARDAFLPAEFVGKGKGLASFVMYVDYVESPCGPYRELLFIPGALPFRDGRRHHSISRILVSTWDSVVNGRRNWGIPKDRADFAVDGGGEKGREHHVRVTVDGRELCDLRFETLRMAPALRVNAALLPERMRTLAQRFDGRDYFYAPTARGRVRPGRLRGWRFDRTLFPDLADAAVVAVFGIESFNMTFPVARVA